MSRRVAFFLSIVVTAFILALVAGSASANTLPTTDQARRMTARLVRKNYGAKLYVEVNAECEQISFATRRCVFHVPGQVYARTSCGFTAPFAGRVRVTITDEGNLYAHQSSSWCSNV